MHPIFNSNTITGIVSESITRDPVSPPIVRCAPLPSIGTRVRLKQIQIGKQHVPHIISNTAAQSNATNFQSGNTEADEIELNVVHISKSSGWSSPELSKGLDTNHISEPLVRLAEQDIWDNHVCPSLAAASFGAADVSSLVADFDETDLETLIAACVSTPRCLLIQPNARKNLADLLQIGPQGWEYPGVASVQEIGADMGDANTVLAGPESFAFAVEQPPFSSAPPGQIHVHQITLPRLGINAWQTIWFDLATRSAWHCVELFFAIAPALPSALAYAADPEE
jgi:hypothetical protein